jgi:F-type H+-transporting ATPase subunit epsilon
MRLEIVSPEATLFSGDVTSVTLPGMMGEFELLNNHAPVISLLKEGNVKINGNITLEEDVEQLFKKSDQGFWLAITSGTLEVKDNKVIVLAD